MISISPYKSAEEQEHIGEMANFRLDPMPRFGNILQLVRVETNLDGDILKEEWTEAWRIRIKNKTPVLDFHGDNFFRVPKSWIENHSGYVVKETHAWYTPDKLDCDFKVNQNHLKWGILRGTSRIIVHPIDTDVIKRTWIAKWKKNSVGKLNIKRLQG